QGSKKASEDLLYQGQRLGEDMKVLRAPKNTDDIRLLIALFDIVGKAPQLDNVDVLSKKWITEQDDIREFIEPGERLSAIYRQYESVLLPEACEQEVLAIRQCLMSHGRKWYRFLISDYRKSTKQLAVICRTTLPDDINTRLNYVN